MPGKLRNLVIKVFMVVLFGLLILSFAVWGIGDIFQGGGQYRAVAEVGDTRIEEQDFTRVLSREVNRMASRFGGRVDIEQARALGVVDQVLGQMVSRALFDQKAADLGLVVTDEQVLQRIQDEPAFHDDVGGFSRDRFIQTLQISGLSEQQYLANLRRDIIRGQIAGVVSRAVPAPRRLAEVLYQYRGEQRVAQILTVPNASVTDVPEPDNAALRAFHGEFSANFMAPEYRAVSYVWLRPEDLAAEIAVSEDQLRDEFEARREEFVTPERRHVEQIILTDEDTARDAESRLANGAEFAALAQDVSGQAPIDLGLVDSASLPGELADAVFAIGVGATTAPLQSALGWHILRVIEVQPRTESTLAEVREDLTQTIAMDQAIESMISIANQLDDELAGGANLDEGARALNLIVRRVEAMDRQGRGPDGNAVADVPRDDFLETLFNTEPGQESLLSETDDGGYYILRVDGVTPSQLRPLEEVQDQVVALWRNAQQANRSREIAVGLAERAQEVAGIETLAEAEGYALTTTVPFTRFETDPAKVHAATLPSKLFQMRVGDVDTVVGQDGHLVVKLLDIQPANPGGAADEVRTVRDALAVEMRSDMLDQFLATLRDEYDVRVNQTRIEEVLTTYF